MKSHRSRTSQRRTHTSPHHDSTVRGEMVSVEHELDLDNQHTLEGMSGVLTGQALHTPSLAHETAQPLRRASVRVIQQTLGNAQVMRELAQRGSAEVAVTIQRKGGAKPPAGQTIIEPVTNTSYDIDATTLQEALDVMEQREEAGETTWEPTVEFETNEKGIVTKAIVRVKIIVEMPNWPGAKNLSPKAEAEWERFRKALGDHEQGHVSLVKQKLANLAARLVGKKQEDAQTLFDTTTQKLQESSDAYDEKTDHGRKTGTIMKTDIQ